MKFGIYSSIADPPAGENLALRVEEVVAEAKLAESMGFDSCFFGEHHQDKDGFLPAPLIVSATVAAQTTKLNLGTSVILVLLGLRYWGQPPRLLMYIEVMMGHACKFKIKQLLRHLRL